MTAVWIRVISSAISALVPSETEPSCDIAVYKGIVFLRWLMKLEPYSAKHCRADQVTFELCPVPIDKEGALWSSLAIRIVQAAHDAEKERQRYGCAASWRHAATANRARDRQPPPIKRHYPGQVDNDQHC